MPHVNQLVGCFHLIAPESTILHALAMYLQMCKCVICTWETKMLLLSAFLYCLKKC